MQNPASFDTEKTLNYTDLTRTHCAKIISSFVSNATEKFVSTADAEQAIDDLRYIQAVTFDPKNKLRRVMKPLENVVSPLAKGFKPSSMFRVDDMQYAVKFANVNHGAWSSPFNNMKRNDSFEDLFEQSKADAIRLIKGFFDNTDLVELTEDLSFLTGERVE